jgi:molecular chaperone HtpG
MTIVENVVKVAHRNAGRPLTVVQDSLDPDDVVVGKDVLELVSSAMYVDPMTIYREYVQNSADAIDEARRQGVLARDERGRVDIDVDQATRTVKLRDNGTGIAWAGFARRLSALGASGKRGTNARGFRGVGRLAGLGYAQELIFRSRSIGDELISELRWDCRKLRAELRASGPDSLVELIRGIVSVARIAPSDHPAHFFEVELKGVVRLRNDKLMNPSAIAEYLGQVSPVPFSPEFRFGTEIAEALRGVVDLGELDIRVSGIAHPVYRPHRDSFAADEKRSIPFQNLQIVEVPGIDGGIAGVAWVLHHDYDGAIPTSALIKGLRMRSGNVQIGDHTLLEDLFPEPRFNVWSVGEVHIVDRRIVPNGRRDHFEQNAHFHNLANHLTPLARDIARLCRTSSVRRKWLREFELHRQSVDEKLGIIAQGSLGKTKRGTIASAVDQAILQMEKIAGMELLIEDSPHKLHPVVKSLRGKLARTMKEKDAQLSPLARLPANKRTMYEHLFTLVYECSTNRSAAKALIDRILHKITS